MDTSPASQINEILSQLVDAWCARRELGPLRQVLSHYPLGTNLTDEWADLASALKSARVRYSQDLPAGEMDLLVRAHQIADSVVHR